MVAFVFEKLLVYQKAVSLADQIAALTEGFPLGYGKDDRRPACGAACHPRAGFERGILLTYVAARCRGPEMVVGRKSYGKCRLELLRASLQVTMGCRTIMIGMPDGGDGWLYRKHRAVT